ncbi:serine/threonine-protein kinase [uncultured Jatrophihabitans sp.]|uniref:serine/threonine-protein kinase n=1 Tax=uncultured Jatrophihabitans sp. TaxID=1610747 RepID=UPI0035C9B84A
MSGAWRLRGYVVEGLLGQGGSGEVWRARVAATGEKVALKRLPVRDEAQVRRAAAEAAKLTVLEHPHLVRLHALVPDSTDVVLVLDLAEGGSLAELLDVRGRLSPGEVITAIAPVAAALAHVHAAGVVHGDVTPANILFTAGGNALLADLGVARLTGEEDDAESTPAYVDPGVALGGIPSELSDVFMLAATALHALTGEIPWPGPTSDEALAQARTGDLGSLPDRLTDAGVPDAMVGVLCRALDRSPGRRGTAAAFALDLRHSGVPVAVELDAGRARREPALREFVPPAPTETRPRGGRHAAVAPGRPSRRDRFSGTDFAPVTPPRIPPAAQPAVLGRPSFSRPVSGAPGGAPARPGAPPPTSRVRPRPRPQLPRPPRRRSDQLPRSRPHTVGIALLVALVLGACGLLVSRHLDTSAGAQPPARAVSQSAAAPTRSIAAEPGIGWPARLSALDAVRARAFAERRPELLRSVYASAALLQADTALLLRIVPPGCGLRGVRTTYQQIRITEGADRVVVSAQAALTASTLVCSGTIRGRAADVGPTSMRLTLVGPRPTARIADQRRT